MRRTEEEENGGVLTRLGPVLICITSNSRPPPHAFKCAAKLIHLKCTESRLPVLKYASKMSVPLGPLSIFLFLLFLFLFLFLLFLLFLVFVLLLRRRRGELDSFYEIILKVFLPKSSRKSSYRNHLESLLTEII